MPGRILASAAVTAALVLAGQPALAQAARDARAACGPDARKLCQGVQPGGGRLLGCLEAHQSELSPQCRPALEALRQRATGTPG